MLGYNADRLEVTKITKETQTFLLLLVRRIRRPLSNGDHRQEQHIEVGRGRSKPYANEVRRSKEEG